MRKDLLLWQWSGYPDFHRSKTNLLLHIFGVPVFFSGFVWAALCLGQGQWGLAAAGFGAAVASFGIQGLGHKRERTAPIPFQGPVDFVTRVMAEQFVTFPRFLISGGWLRALRQTERGGQAAKAD